MAITIGRVALNPRGNYSQAEEYKRLDLITYNNIAYASTEDNNLGNIPTESDKWQIVLDNRLQIERSETFTDLYNNWDFGAYKTTSPNGNTEVDCIVSRIPEGHTIPYARHKYIEVQPLESLTFNATFLAEDEGIVFFGKDGKKIGAESIDSTKGDPAYNEDWYDENDYKSQIYPKYKVIAPVGCYYIGVSWNGFIINEHQEIAVNHNTTDALIDTQETVISMVDTLDKINTKSIITSGFKNGAINWKDGTVINRTEYQAKYINASVKPLSKITFIGTFIGFDDDGFAYYDKDGNYISGGRVEWQENWQIPNGWKPEEIGFTATINNSIFLGYSITVPNDERIASISLCWNNGSIDNQQRIEINRDTTGALVEMIEEHSNQPHKGKNLFCCGDSQTQRCYSIPSVGNYILIEGSYIDTLQKTTGMNLVGATPTIAKTIDGYNGGSIRGIVDYFNDTANVDASKVNWDTLDFFTIFLGVNDWNGNDVTNEQLRQGTRNIINYVKGKNKDIQIVFATNPIAEPYGGAVEFGFERNDLGLYVNGFGNTVYDTNKIITDTAKMMGCPVCDTYSLMNITPSTLREYCPDGVHLTTEASGKFGKILANFINNLV